MTIIKKGSVAEKIFKELLPASKTQKTSTVPESIKFLKEKFISKGKNPFSVRTLKFINNYKESLKVAKTSKPCIIIAASGMCEAGRILNHLQYGISNKNNTILFVGYQAQGTLGRSILEKAEKIIINKKEYEV